MEKEATIKGYARELRRFIDSSDDLLAIRIAYEVESALHRVVEDVVGWPPVVQSVMDAAELLRKEFSITPRARAVSTGVHACGT